VEVREVGEIEELDGVARLFAEVWGEVTVPVSRDLLRALSHEGNYVAGAFDRGALVGASMAFLGHPGPSLHSHITGVRRTAQGRGVGLALKSHQRSWALARGIPAITWTFDPLVRRNAWFNLGKLGAVGVEYLPDFYGSMADAVNAGDLSDRLLVRWDVADPPDRPAGAGERVCEVPPDIESLRRTDPAAARAWRLRVRDALGEAMAGGAMVVGMDRDGWYLVGR
jgi:predicted GNAT superfamily acetyltransferase